VIEHAIGIETGSKGLCVPVVEFIDIAVRPRHVLVVGTDLAALQRIGNVGDDVPAAIHAADIERGGCGQGRL
jgi:hypothetical protein